MKYRRLGKTKMRVSVVGVGTWQLGGEWGKVFEQTEVNDMLAAAAQLGINLIDTAECYGDHLSERLIGHAIKGTRDKWIVATKFGHKFNQAFERDDLFEPDQVRAQLEESLRALQTDYIDLYQFHSGTDAAFDKPELWEMLRAQVKAGKIRHLGISVSSKVDGTHQVGQALNVGAEAIQVVYNRLQRTPEDKVFPASIKDDLAVLARVPLASGFLSGKYAIGSEFADDDVRAVWKDAKQRDRIIRKVDSLRSDVPGDVPMSQWALAWCLKHHAVSCVIPGCKTIEQIESNAAAADLPQVADNHPQAVA